MAPGDSLNPLSHEEWYRIVTSSMPTIAWATDLELRFVWGTGAGLEMLGLRPNQLNGQSLYEYFEEDDVDCLPIRMHFQALAGRRVTYSQMWGDRFYHTYLEPLRNEFGDITGCLGLSIDISSSMSANHNKRTTALSRIAFRESPRAMVVCELPNLEVKMVNNQFLAVTGFQHQHVTGNPLQELECWNDPEELKPLSRIEPGGARIDGAPCSFNYVGPVEPGDLENATSTIAAYSARAVEMEGEPHLIFTLDTISLNTEVEAAVKKVANFEQYASVVPAMLYQIRGKNNSTEIAVDFVSPFVTELLGLSAEAICQDPMLLFEAIHPDDRGLYYGKALTATEKKSPFEIEMRMVGVSGQVRWVRCVSRPYTLNDDEIVFHGACFDIHDSMQREQNLKQSVDQLIQLRHDEKQVTDSRNRSAIADAAEARRNALCAQATNALLQKTIDLQERERKLVSYELHDGLVQDIVGASYTVQGLKARLGDEHECAPELAMIERMLNSATIESRRLVRELRPKSLQQLSLVEAIRNLISEEEASGDFRIEFTHTDIGELPPVLAAAAMRIIQESINNVRRHAQIDYCRVGLTRDEGQLKLVVEDHGCGFDSEAVPPNRYGLESIRERARIFGGVATITSKPGEGTRVMVQLPAATIESLG